MNNKNEKFEILKIILWDRYTNYSKLKIGKTCQVISMIMHWEKFCAFWLAEIFFYFLFLSMTEIQLKKNRTPQNFCFQWKLTKLNTNRISSSTQWLKLENYPSWYLHSKMSGVFFLSTVYSFLCFYLSFFFCLKIYLNASCVPGTTQGWRHSGDKSRPYTSGAYGLCFLSHQSAPFLIPLLVSLLLFEKHGYNWETGKRSGNRKRKRKVSKSIFCIW